jgi:hypothetical protein
MDGGADDRYRAMAVAAAAALALVGSITFGSLERAATSAAVSAAVGAVATTTAAGR